jgi:hypothetical protein
MVKTHIAKTVVFGDNMPLWDLFRDLCFDDVDSSELIAIKQGVTKSSIISTHRVKPDGRQGG